jgi:hypothetical protein
MHGAAARYGGVEGDAGRVERKAGLHAVQGTTEVDRGWRLDALSLDTAEVGVELFLQPRRVGTGTPPLLHLVAQTSDEFVDIESVRVIRGHDARILVVVRGPNRFFEPVRIPFALVSNRSYRPITVSQP